MPGGNGYSCSNGGRETERERVERERVERERSERGKEKRDEGREHEGERARVVDGLMILIRHLLK